MSSKGKFYMTTAIAYTSGKPHIGNTYEIVLADAIARYKKMCIRDRNRSITECYSIAYPAERQGEIFHRYILGVYDLYERLTSESVSYTHLSGTGF